MSRVDTSTPVRDVILISLGIAVGVIGSAVIMQPEKPQTTPNIDTQELAHITDSLERELLDPEVTGDIAALHRRLKVCLDPADVDGDVERLIGRALWLDACALALAPSMNAGDTDTVARSLDLDELLANAPPETPQAVLESVQTVADDLRAQVDSQQQEAALQMARRAKSRADIASAMTALSEVRPSEEVQEALKHLQQESTQLEFRAIVADLANDSQHARNIQSPSLRLSALRQVSIVARQVAVDMVPHENEQIRDLVRQCIDIAKESEAPLAAYHSSRRTNYQSWAASVLQEVATNDFKSLKKSLKEAEDSDDEARKAVEKRLTESLGPIDVQLLEPALANVYNQLYLRDLDVLDEADRFEAAKKVATTQKRGLDDVE